jgi:hypothetical protein
MKSQEFSSRKALEKNFPNMASKNVPPWMGI